jgi:uridine phosphorylase
MLKSSPCLINPKRSRSEPEIDPLALLIPIPGDFKGLVRLFSQDGSLGYTNDFLRVFQVSESLTATALAGPAVGAPQAVMILEKLIVLGARWVILFGWVGSLNPNLAPGDLILPDSAVSEEGTSSHYSNDGRPRPSSLLLEELKRSLNKEGLAYHQGPVWTTDALYRETIDQVRAFQSQGVLGVDMETSAFFTVSTFRGIEAAALLIVSDDLSGMAWRHGFRDPAFLQARKKVGRFLYQFILRSAQVVAD